MQDLLHSFPGQELHEPVYVFARPHPLAFLSTALVFLFIFAFSLLVQFAILNNFIVLDRSLVNGALLILGVFQLFTLVVFLATIFDFYYDIVIVTDRRVVDIDQEMLFFRRVSVLDLENVEDVSARIQGILPTFFNYGLVDIQTAGTQRNFLMENVHFPNEVTAIVLDLSQQAKRNIPEEERIPQSKTLAVIDGRIISEIAELRSLGAILPDDLRRVQR